ncbi:MAG: hypothetical protein AAF433_08515 [Bacteroidota bacterium]
MSRFILSVGLLGAISLCLQAQDVVDSQLSRITELMVNDNYEKTHDYEFDWLEDDESDNYYIRLSQYYNYKIIAVCDQDCEDIDMKIYDENGKLLDEDVAEDDVPIVELTPRTTGRYRVYLKMYDCDVEPCKVGIAVYGR